MPLFPSDEQMAFPNPIPLHRPQPFQHGSQKHPPARSSEAGGSKHSFHIIINGIL